MMNVMTQAFFCTPALVCGLVLLITAGCSTDVTIPESVLAQEELQKWHFVCETAHSDHERVELTAP